VIALCKFTGVVDGVQVVFQEGETIDAATAKELKLSAKPHLAKNEPTKGASKPNA
jgi:hypothetical protein